MDLEQIFLINRLLELCELRDVKGALRHPGGANDGITMNTDDS